MGQWFKNNVWGLVAGFLAGGLLVGGVLSSAADSLYGKAAQATQSAASTSVSVDPAFPAAANQDQLVLFEASKKSCDAIAAGGASYTYSDGSLLLLGPSKDGVGNPLIAYAQINAAGAVAARGIFSDSAPVPCLPDQVNTQVLRGSKTLASEFLVEPSMGGTYMWHSHLGSDELTNIHITVTDGMITNYSDVRTMDQGGGVVTQISYGLTNGQSRLLKQ